MKKTDLHLEKFEDTAMYTYDAEKNIETSNYIINSRFMRLCCDKQTGELVKIIIDGQEYQPTEEVISALNEELDILVRILPTSPNDTPKH